MSNIDFKIFRANRLTFSELRDDAYAHIRKVYNTKGQEMTMASPFAQIVNVIVNLGRMILFYIENVITEMNIETAVHTRSIKGLMSLTGHNVSRGIGARGTVIMSYNMSGDRQGTNVMIRNHTKIMNTSNGLEYTMMMPSSSMNITVGENDSGVEIPVIQGTLCRQQRTGTGYSLQSFNFASKNGSIIDNFYVNVYVNGKRWKVVDSIMDMGYDEKACVVKSLVGGGIDLFFGTGNNGDVPELGSSIILEYLETAGSSGNINDITFSDTWKFVDSGMDTEGDYVDLNSIYNISSGTEMLFGSDSENLEMTRRMAPHMSRSFVLANPVNYKCFLGRLGMFSVIDVFSGFKTYEDVNYEAKYSDAKTSYNSARESYLSQCALTGSNSSEALALYSEMNEKREYMEAMKERYDNASMDDNVVYLYLVPDVSKRFGNDENYFTCSIDRFSLTESEKEGILSLIDDSGQRIVTTENRIMDPLFVRFAINIYVRIWSDYSFDSVKSSIVSAVSNYLVSTGRSDRIPISDIISAVRGVSGVDSVTAFFDPDVRNCNYYGEGNYGIDSYGDVVMHRSVTDTFGNSIEVRDVTPLFRGGFTGVSGAEYSDGLDSLLPSINITLTGRSSKSL